MSPSASRRTVLTLGALVPLGLTTACTGSATNPGGEAAQPDPDEALLDEVRASTSNARAQVDAVLGTPTGRQESQALGDLRRCLDAHLAAFGTPGDTAAAPQTTPAATPGAAATSVVPTAQGMLDAVRTHHGALTDACARAESGNFARLLACASAGISQHLAPLATFAPQGGGR